MIIFYALFFLIGIISFFLLRKTRILKRFFITLLIVLFLCTIFTLLIITTGDRPSPEARTVTLEELECEGL